MGGGVGVGGVPGDMMDPLVGGLGGGYMASLSSHMQGPAVGACVCLFMYVGMCTWYVCVCIHMWAGAGLLRTVGRCVCIFRYVCM